MTSAVAPKRRPAVAVVLFLLGSALFAAAYGLAPLYYSNQNQYFLHGLAAAGQGLLAEDWLANTADPTPVFSALVAFTARYLHPWAFYAYHALLLGAYATALLGLFAALAGPDRAKQRWPIFLALFVAVHSALARWLSYRAVGFDYPWFLQAGVAGQYILGAMFQPSFFGVILVVSVSLFMRGQHLLAAICVGIVGALHSTYLLHAGLLTLGFLTALLVERQVRTAVMVGGVALALALPVALFVLFRFGPTSPDDFREAQDILVNLRIPHHCRPDLWIDPVAFFQIAWMVFALALVWGSRLFAVMVVPFVLAVLLTLAQVATGSQTLALLFPWRISSVLVPIATTVILTRLVALPALPLSNAGVRWASWGLLAVLASAGVAIMATRQGFRSGDEELVVMDYVGQTKSPGDVYLLPVRIPNLVAATRGSLSSDFKPLAEKQRDVRVIPVNLQRFRLRSGAPIYVDFKSIPYTDVEVIEWRDRLRQAESIQNQIDAGQWNEALSQLRRLAITHVVLPAGVSVQSSGLKKIHEDVVYTVYKLTELPQ